MPQSKGLAAAIRVKAAHRTTEASEIHRVAQIFQWLLELD
jgi:hypothetical protein